MNSEEIWKPIKGYEGLYEVSNLGRVRSLDRLVVDTIGRSYLVKGCIKHPQIGTSGYYTIGLSKDGKSKSNKVHRLVAEVFVDNPYNKPYIDHINTIRTDCRACNLRWVTLKENSNNQLTKHHAKFGSSKVVLKRERNKIHLSKSSPNYPIRLYRYSLTGEYIDEFKSMIDAELSTGIEINGIRKALNKSHRTAGGYLWRTNKVERCNPYKRRRHTKCRKIIMIDSYGNVRKEWASMRDAAKEINTTHTRIYNHIRAKTPIDGYWFMYK